MDVLAWLLDGDPAIRWQTLRHLTGASPAAAARERSRVGKEGWGARLLRRQAPDGQWGGGAYSPKWISTTYTLLLLRHCGLDPRSLPARTAVSRVRRGVTMGRHPFFEYRGEACITGMVLALAAYFEQESDGAVEFLLDKQREDGGWNCEARSTRSSFHTTLSAIEGLLEHERVRGPAAEVAAARARGHEYFLERRLLRSLSTGEEINPRWSMLSFPPRWHYDVLRCLDYLRDAAIAPDPRCEEAIAIVERKRLRDGRWPLQAPHAGREHFVMEKAGEPSRWNTLRALRVLAWHRGAAQAS